MAEPAGHACVNCTRKYTGPMPALCSGCHNPPDIRVMAEPVPVAAERVPVVAEPVPVVAPVPSGGAVLQIGAAGAEIALPDGVRVTLGRMANDDRIWKALNPFDDVGRRHAAVTVRGAEVAILDLDSTCGTFVGGRRLQANEEVVILLPVVIRLGSECNVRLGPPR